MNKTNNTHNKSRKDKKEKVNKLAVIISNKSGKCYQVLLSKEESQLVKDLIARLHDGKITVLETELDLEIK